MFCFDVGIFIVTCKVSGSVFNVFCIYLFGLIGGSVDLVGFNGIMFKEFGYVGVDGFGVNVCNIYYGVCEHVMGVIMNGMSLYGGYCLYGGIFLMFSDYMWFFICLVVLMY